MTELLNEICSALVAATMAATMTTGAAPVVVKQDEDRPPSIEVPASGESAEGFVPRRWRIESEDDDVTAGDLNGDGVADRVLRLVQDTPNENADGTLRTRFRALVVLLGKAGGGFKRVAATTRLLLCPLCAGVRGDPSGGGNIQLRVERGVIVVEQQSGSRFAYDHTLRFRHDRATNRFLLVGEDFDNRDTATGERTEESSNYLTGNKITRRFRYDQRRDDEVLVSERRARIARPRKFLEEVDYNDR